MHALLDRWLSRRRLDRWRRERTAMFTGAELLVVSHTKSGRTWLRVLLSHVYHRRYGLPEEQLLRFDNFQRLAPAVPRVHFARDTRFPPDQAGPGGVTPAPAQRVAILFRDPRDVAVSFYFHVLKRASAAELERKGIPAAAKALSLFDFVCDAGLGVPRVIRFYNRWQAELPGFPRHLRLRYEDLRADTAAELARLMAFLGTPASAAELEAAVAFAAFDAMRAKEQEGFFRSGRFGAVAPGDPESVKVREGRVGGYRAHLSVEEAATLDRLVATTLDPALGYGGPVA
jgi:hypothetical protein